ncbi:MAG: hypothetical protein IJA49_05010 [Oscillospiraceae bacterium]|nr:hypothetical protein [Oscillospiraceae bacterium]
MASATCEMRRFFLNSFSLKMMHHPLTKEYQKGIIEISRIGITVRKGGSLMDQYRDQGNQTGIKRLHCPHCRSQQLIAVTEATQSGGVATTNRVTRNSSMTTYSANTINRHYWMCRECGHKFRNLEDLNAELKQNTRIAEVNKKLTAIFAVALLVSMLTIILAGGLLGILMILVMFVATVGLGITLGLWLRSQLVVKKLAPEKAFLEQHCFD